MSIRGITSNPLAHIHGPSNDTWDIIGAIVLISTLVIVYVMFAYMAWVDVPRTEANIESLSCGELIDYIADKEKRWGYAEHRYTWTCEK